MGQNDTSNRPAYSVFELALIKDPFLRASLISSIQLVLPVEPEMAKLMRETLRECDVQHRRYSHLLQRSKAAVAAMAFHVREVTEAVTTIQDGGEQAPARRPDWTHDHALRGTRLLSVSAEGRPTPDQFVAACVTHEGPHAQWTDLGGSAWYVPL